MSRIDEISLALGKAAGGGMEEAGAMTVVILIAALLGGVWRWWDGRGYGPGWARLVVSALIAFAILWPLGWYFAAPLATLWAALWMPRQKNREEFDDMLLRWGGLVGLFGLLLAPVMWDWAPIPIMAAAGVIVASLVWGGVHIHAPKWFPSWLDSAAITEALAGAAAFGGLAFAVWG